MTVDSAIEMPKPKVIGCLCLDWQLSWPQIEVLQLEAHNKGRRYTGKVMKFCPWCGNKTKIIEW